MQKPTLTVSQVNKYIKDILSSNIILSNILVRGEISNFKSHFSGHMYFTLKDEGSTIKCVMFKSSCDNLIFQPQNGMKVIIQGKVSVYEKDGSYQLYANDMQADGIGSLHIAFEQLKKKLELEGLFHQSMKKKIPYFPKHIGVVTSPTGAAVKDIINVITRRNRNANIIIYPVQVQGTGAGPQVSNAIDTFNILKNVDVIIVGRGGGSIEELWAFNEEIVARSISNSIIPIISAVGHETDFTIADFVSDLRAPTPSAAAELVVPNTNDIQFTLNNYKSRLKFSIEKILNHKKLELKAYMNSTIFRDPKDIINQNRIDIDNQNRFMLNAMNQIFKIKHQKFHGILDRLSSLSPLSTMKRGYSVSTINKNVIKSIESIKIDDNIDIRVYDGKIKCKVINLEGVEIYGKGKNF